MAGSKFLSMENGEQFVMTLLGLTMHAFFVACWDFPVQHRIDTVLLMDKEVEEFGWTTLAVLGMRNL